MGSVTSAPQPRGLIWMPCRYDLANDVQTSPHWTHDDLRRGSKSEYQRSSCVDWLVEDLKGRLFVCVLCQSQSVFIQYEVSDAESRSVCFQTINLASITLVIFGAFSLGSKVPSDPPSSEEDHVIWSKDLTFLKYLFYFWSWFPSFISRRARGWNSCRNYHTDKIIQACFVQSEFNKSLTSCLDY